jgi:hypothetical protein
MILVVTSSQWSLRRPWTDRSISTFISIDLGLFGKRKKDKDAPGAWIALAIPASNPPLRLDMRHASRLSNPRRHHRKANGFICLYTSSFLYIFSHLYPGSATSKAR